MQAERKPGGSREEMKGSRVEAGSKLKGSRVEAESKPVVSRKETGRKPKGSREEAERLPSGCSPASRPASAERGEVDRAQTRLDAVERISIMCSRFIMMSVPKRPASEGRREGGAPEGMSTGSERERQEDGEADVDRASRCYNKSLINTPSLAPCNAPGGTTSRPDQNAALSFSVQSIIKNVP